MGLDYSALQTEVKRRTLRSEGGTEFDAAIKNAINAALFSLSKEGLWRTLRRKSSFDTVTTYSTGSGAGTFTNDSKSVTITGATFLTDNVQPGRRISLQGSTAKYRVATITGETTLTLDQVYNGTTISGTGTYSILAQEEYNLPIQTNHKTFLWHEEFAFPYRLHYITDQDFYNLGINNEDQSTPTHYRMWGEDSVKEQVKAASVITISSSATADTNIAVTVFGTVAGYPDCEVITTNSSDGTTTVAGSKSFTNVDRIVCSHSRTGRISCTADSANTTVSVLPVGDTVTSIKYSKIQLWPLPNAVFPMHVHYYQAPYALVNSGDVHEFGDDFNEALILLASYRIKYEQGQIPDGDRMRRAYQDELRKLKRSNSDKIDWAPTLRRGMRGRLDPLIHPSLSFRQVGADFGPRTR